MGRMIDADAFCDEMRHRQNECAKWRDETDDESIKTRADGALSAFIECKLTLDKMPTIEERKTGTWCVTPDGKLVCSNCNNNPTNRIIVDGSLIYDMTPIKKRMRYCPHCGASMVEGEEKSHDS